MKPALLLVLTFITYYSYSQETNCSKVLKKAQVLYDAGRISEIEPLIAPCLEEGFSIDEKVTALKLLTLIYLYYNEKKKAEQSMKAFLKLNPEYELNRSIDPAEFINLYNIFRTAPAFLVGLKAGGNAVDVDVKKNFSLDNSAVSRGEYYPAPGYQIGAVFVKPLSFRFSFYAEVNFISQRYGYTDSLFNYSYITFNEDLNWLQLPLLLSFRFGKSKTFFPYIYAGGTIDYLLSASAVVNRKDKTIDGKQREVLDRKIDMTSQRNRYNFTAAAGGGFRLKNVIGRGFIYADLRYSVGLRNIVDPLSRFAQPELMYDYLFVDNDFKINCLQLSLGYSLPLYIPKLKTKRPDHETR